MSKETYMRGFCKAAAARGIDPAGLAAMTKQALSMSDINKMLSEAYGKARNAWHGVPDEYKPLVGGLAGGAAGAGLGAVGGGITGLGAGKGALAGFGLGGIGGSLYGARSAHRSGQAKLRKSNAEWSGKLKSQIDASAAELAKAQAEAAKKEENLKGLHAADVERFARAQQAADKAHAKAMAKNNAEWSGKLKSQIDASAAELAKAQAEAAKKEEALARAMKGLGSENAALRGVVDMTNGMTEEEFYKKSPEERQAIMKALHEYYGRIGSAMSAIKATDLIHGLSGAPVSEKAQAWYEDKQKERDAANWRNALRTAEKSN